MKHLKTTPFLIVLGIVEVILLVVALNYLFVNNKGGMALAGLLAFIAALIIFIILAIEQGIAKSISNLKVLWAVEIIILIPIAIYVLMNGITIG